MLHNLSLLSILFICPCISDRFLERQLDLCGIDLNMILTMQKIFLNMILTSFAPGVSGFIVYTLP